MKRKRKNNVTHPRGFSLLETIIAITVMSLTITAVSQLTNSSLRTGRYALNRLAAYEKAQEGLEAVRNMRDSNWLQNRSWRQGLESGTYALNATTRPFSLIAANSADDVLDLVPIITIETETGEVMRVQSAVFYGGKTAIRKSVSLTMDLTDWKKGPL